jgi:hypothetical protein
MCPRVAVPQRSIALLAKQYPSRKERITNQHEQNKSMMIPTSEMRAPTNTGQIILGCRGTELHTDVEQTEPKSSASKASGGIGSQKSA